MRRIASLRPWRLGFRRPYGGRTSPSRLGPPCVHGGLWAKSPLARAILLASALACAAAACAAATDEGAPPQLPGTQPLTIRGDFAEITVAGVDRFLLERLEASVAERAAHWNRDFSSPLAYADSVESNRARFARMIGLVDERISFEDVELVATRTRPALFARGQSYDVYAIRWPVFEGVYGEGLLLEPVGRAAVADVVAIPDCEQTPETLCVPSTDEPPIGGADGTGAIVLVESQFARRLAESGCRVVVPLLVDRGHDMSVVAGRVSGVTHRELLYRPAYQMGRHLIGYEVQKVLGAVDWLEKSSYDDRPIGVVGYGEGGSIALYAAAVDRRIDAAGVSGYFDSRQNLWQEPIDRNVFGLLTEFGDAEIASLVAPRALVVESCAAPSGVIQPGDESAPARLRMPDPDAVRNEVERARALLAGLDPAALPELVESSHGNGPFGCQAFLEAFLQRLAAAPLAPSRREPERRGPGADPAARRVRQFRELAAYSQRLVDGGPEARAAFFENLDRNRGVERFQETQRPYREYFRERIIGSFDEPLLPPNARTRLAYDTDSYRGYEVVLDVFPHVILYGILLVPKDLSAGERRPVVVCQHGLEGQSQSTVEGDNTSYRDFASYLAERGFVTFSPQHLYRGGDRFRTLQRKANPLGKSLFAVMTAQHRQLLAWLAAQEFVDAKRIAFYGISYGGKSAMRIPAQLEGYCLSICSSDFSNWIWRTVSNRHANGYLAHSEYEIFEFGLGGTFNYAEMAALICPRPFAVERLNDQGLVANMDYAEYGRVQLLYDSLGLADRLGISYFPEFQAGTPYENRATFDFLHEQLRWPKR